MICPEPRVDGLKKTPDRCAHLVAVVWYTAKVKRNVPTGAHGNGSEVVVVETIRASKF